MICIPPGRITKDGLRLFVSLSDIIIFRMGKNVTDNILWKKQKVAMAKDG